MRSFVAPRGATHTVYIGTIANYRRLTNVNNPDEEQVPVESQRSAHNKPPERAARIRMSWYVILAIFILLGVTAAMIMSR